MIYTASWSSLYKAHHYVDDLPVAVVRISRGVPRFWPPAQSFPAIDELMPDGWMFGIKDDEKFGRCFRRKLHTIGFERIQARLDAISQRWDKPLALCCFEPDHRDCHRGQVAALWERWTGEPIFDLALIVSRRGDYVALCHEVE